MGLYAEERLSIQQYYHTQSEAVNSAKRFAKKNSVKNKCSWTESVLMDAFTTLIITASPSGRFKQRLIDGWYPDRDHDFHCSSNCRKSME